MNIGSLLGTFVSTFLYCLLVLRTIRGTDDTEFVPHLAVTLGVILAILSLGVLIVFIHHVATSIQASRIIARVASDLEVAADHLFPRGVGRPDADAAEDASLAVVPGIGESRDVLATKAGYVQAIDGERLVAVAREREVSLRLHVRPGAFVRNGTVQMTVCSSTFVSQWTDQPCRSAVIIASERSGTQDIEFFINQLVELAVRALSPGINDPATARSCIDRLEQVLCDLASRRFPSPVRHDGDGIVRVVACPVNIATLVDSAFDEIGRYGQSSVSVTCRLLEAVRNISTCVTHDGDRRPLSDQAAAIAERSRRVGMAAGDRDRIEEWYDAARVALGGAKEPSVPG